MKEITGKHWLVVLALAVAAHGALIGLFYEKPHKATARQAGISGIMVSLGPAGGASGTPEPEAAAVEEIEAPVIEPPPAPKPVAEAPRPKPKKIEKPKPRQVAKKKPHRRQEPRESVIASSKPPEPIGIVGQSGTKQASNAGSQNNTAGGGRPGPKPDYIALLQAWLEKHKEYPRRARLRRQEGTVLLSFVMTRNGEVLNYNIERSSGFSLLDHEVQDMIKRAQPLPPIPDDMKQARLALVVPVQFFLR